MNYKKTLNIPSTGFPMKAGLVENEVKFKLFWKNKNIFERLCLRNLSDKFTLHDGPPYANGNIHLGHALNKILKDLVLRYKALRGFSIDYVPGWDTHGLPIENKLEKSGDYKDKSNLEKRSLCRKYALKQIEIQKQQFERLHLLTDFKKIYKTLDTEFIKEELEIFYKFIEEDLVYWALKPVAWSWSSQTALAESEIIYKEIKSKSVYFWFPISNKFKDLPETSKFLIWTTTPYTIEANLAITLNPNLRYSVIKNQNGVWIIEKNRSLDLDFSGGEIIGEYEGRYFEGATYKNPLTKETCSVILADYVTDVTGTGIVHCAPGFGLEDYFAASNYGIKIHSAIQSDGVFGGKSKFGDIVGLFYEKASETIIEWLRGEGYLFKEEIILHKIGHDWRTEKPLIYRASPQWFIDIKKISKRIESIDFRSIPGWLSKKLRELLLSRNEWCLSRQRVWGTPIPMLFDDGKPILDLRQIRHTINLLNREGVESWYEKDAEFFLCSGVVVKGVLSKGEDILDVWFDSGCSWSMLPNKSADLYLEGFDQLRGWFNSSSTISLAVQDKIPFKSILAHGFVIDGEGNKMSKSKGNVVDPMDIVNKYGADILRLWLGMSNYLEDVRLSDASLQSTVTIYRKIRNTLFRYSLSIIGEGFKPNVETLSDLKEPENQYIYELFKESYRETLKNLDDLLFFKAVQSNLNFLNVYSSWWLEISKDTLYCCKKESKKYQEAVNIVYEVFHKSLIFYSIFIPQTAEEAYGYTERREDSVVLETLPKPIDSEYEIDKSMWDRFFELKDEVYGIIEEFKNNKVISGSVEAKVVIPKDRQIEGLDLVKLLNVAEIVEGDSVNVSKSDLLRCERCKRLKGTSLCDRCFKSMN